MYWEIFAIVKDGQIVNIQVFEHGTGYTVANVLAHEIYGNHATAINVNNFPVHIGDNYDGQDFYHDGVKVERIPTDTERVDALEVENARLNTAVDDLAVVVLMEL